MSLYNPLGLRPINEQQEVFDGADAATRERINDAARRQTLAYALGRMPGVIQSIDSANMKLDKGGLLPPQMAFEHVRLVTNHTLRSLYRAAVKDISPDDLTPTGALDIQARFLGVAVVAPDVESPADIASESAPPEE